MDGIMLSVVIPVYNEEKAIVDVLREHIHILEGMAKTLGRWEIVCLDDGSSDQSVPLMQQVAKTNTNVIVLRNPHNKGITATFQELFLRAKGEYIYATGADGQWPAENCQRLWARARARGADLVIGVRENRGQIYGPWRKVLSYGFNLLPQMFFKVRTADANGIKLGRREIFQLDLMSRSFFSEIERIIKARDKGFKIDFTPVLFLPRASGKARGAKWGNIAAVLKDLFRYICSRKQ